jgi:prepilin peptidase CpaA
MPQTAAGFVLGFWAMAVAWDDLRHRRVPNTLLLLMLVPAVLALAINGQGLLGAGVGSSMVGLLVAGLSGLPGYVMGYSGAGDVKLAGFLGLLLGFGGAVEMVLVASVLFGATSLLAWWNGGEAVRERRLPHGPAFVVAFAAQLLFGRFLPLPF